MEAISDNNEVSAASVDVPDSSGTELKSREQALFCLTQVSGR